MPTSPKDYEKRIRALGLDRKYSIMSPTEARTAKADVAQLQKELRQIKREIDMDIKAIRGQYSERMATAAQKSSGLLTIMGKRGTAGHLLADEKRRLSQEQNRALQPYNTLKLSIDAQIVALDKVKTEIESYLSQSKTVPPIN